MRGVTRSRLNEPRVSVLERASRADASGFTTPGRVAKVPSEALCPLRVSARSRAAASGGALARVDVVLRAEFPNASLELGNQKASFAVSWLPVGRFHRDFFG